MNGKKSQSVSQSINQSIINNKSVDKKLINIFINFRSFHLALVNSERNVDQMFWDRRLWHSKSCVTYIIYCISFTRAHSEARSLYFVSFFRLGRSKPAGSIHRHPKLLLNYKGLYDKATNVIWRWKVERYTDKYALPCCSNVSFFFVLWWLGLFWAI